MGEMVSTEKQPFVFTIIAEYQTKSRLRVNGGIYDF